MSQRFRLAPSLRNLHDGAVSLGHEGNHPLGAPTSPIESRKTNLRETHWSSSAHRNRRELSAIANKSDPLAVRRKKRILATFRSRNRPRLQPIHRPDVKPRGEVTWPGGINQTRTIGRDR